jgi:N-acetylglucosamine-6-sulfatase
MPPMRLRTSRNTGLIHLTVVLLAIGLINSSRPQQGAAGPKDGRPNIVVIMTDDLDNGSLDTAITNGLMPEFVTRVRDQAVHFVNSFVSYSLCCPSRATFLTAQYAHNHHVLHNGGPDGGCGVFDDRSTLGTWLQAAGYRTGLVGKYLNGYGSRADPGTACHSPTYVPPGWTDWQALIYAQAMYNYKINDNGSLVSYGSTTASYQTDVLRQRALDFINESPRNRPFFLYVATAAPHSEPSQTVCTDNIGPAITIRPHPTYAHLADSIPLPQPASFNEDDVMDKPPSVQAVPPMTSTDISCTERVWRDKLESMKSVDVLLGDIDSLIQGKGRTNTVFIFTSDNGFFHGEHRLHGKIIPYEEALRVPLFIRHPSSPMQRDVTEFAVNTDLAATIAAIATVTPGLPVDGQSLVPFLEGQTPGIWRKRFLLEYFTAEKTIAIPTFAGVRTANSDPESPNVQYVEHDDEDLSREFYDLNNDPGELESTYVPGGVSERLVQFLLDLKTCGGGTCQDLENQ